MNNRISVQQDPQVHITTRIIGFLKRKRMLRKDGTVDRDKLIKLLEKNPHTRYRNIGAKTENAMWRMAGLPEI